jgi:hypothetical protein
MIITLSATFYSQAAVVMVSAPVSHRYGAETHGGMFGSRIINHRDIRSCRSGGDVEEFRWSSESRGLGDE